MYMYDVLKAAYEHGFPVLICDTTGNKHDGKITELSAATVTIKMRGTEDGDEVQHLDSIRCDHIVSVIVS